MSNKCLVESNADKAAIELHYAQHDESEKSEFHNDAHLLEISQQTESNPLLVEKVRALNITDVHSFRPDP